MSADYGTKHLKGYHHDECVYVVLGGDPNDWYNQCDTPLGMFTPEIVSEFQSITDQWKEVVK